MSSPRIPRVQVYLEKASNQRILAKFGECIVKFFGFADKGSGYVGLTQEKDGFVVHELTSFDDTNAILLRHASECPVYKMTNKATLSQETKDKGVGIGVAVLLASLDQCVLVTRRAPHMRTFPGVWVPPGGHVEPGETLLAAGLRELKEETGLELKDTGYHLLGLWESVYPHKLEFGHPLRQHLVIYLVLTSNLSSRELTEQIKLEPEETDAAMWLPFSFVEKLSTGHSVEEIPKQLSVLQHVGGKNEQYSVETAPIVEAIAPPPDSSFLDIERLTWGTRFALQQWMKWNQNKTNEYGSKL